MKRLEEIVAKMEEEVKKGYSEWKQEQLEEFVREGRAIAMCMMGEVAPESKMPKIDIEDRFMFAKDLMETIKRYVDLSIENAEDRINKRIDYIVRDRCKCGEERNAK